MGKGVYKRNSETIERLKTQGFQSGFSTFKGRTHSEETKRKIRLSLLGKNTEEKGPAWKGDKVGYSALHKWVRKKKNKANECTHCHLLKSKYQWANISGEYKRDVNDWISLCIDCHVVFDRNRRGNKGNYVYT